MSEAPNKAVFLSYASQDAEAAKKICEALRAAGVEVWFDQSELRGGDTWDAKIRRQIRECTLFVPVISATTQARGEGYFRLEWKLAVDRSHLMADDAHFLFPVVIDDTPDAGARVPDKFREVQWTRLNVKDTPETLAVRVSRLLSGGVEARDWRQETGDGDRRGGGKGRRSARLWAAFGLVFALYYGLLPLWKSLRSRERNPSTVAPASTVPPALSPSNGLFEAQQLVAQARELIYDPDSGRTEFSLAENLLKRATDLAPSSGAAWGASALLNQYLYTRAYDLNRERLVRSQAEAEKALRLDARCADALLALGLQRLSVGEGDRAKDYLDRAHAADPENIRVITAQCWQLADPAAHARALLDAAARAPHPAELFYYAADRLTYLGRFDEAAAASDRAIAAQPFWRTLVYRAGIEYLRSADAVKMIGWLDKVPEIRRDEPRVAVMRYKAARLQRDADTAVRVLNGLAADYLEDNFFVGPKAFLMAQAQELAGHAEAATEQWQLAERTVRDKITANPAVIQWRAMLAVILAGEHRLAEARAAADACATDERLGQASQHLGGATDSTIASEYVAEAYIRLDELPRAIKVLRHSPYAGEWGEVSAATLAVEPRWAPLHGQPGYAELVEEMKRAENRKPDGPVASNPVVLTAANVGTAAPLSEARQLVAKARALFENPLYTRDDLALAEDLCKQAVKLEPNDGEVWAVYAELSGEMIGGGTDYSMERREAARAQAGRAVKLAPDSLEARYAFASFLRRSGDAPSMKEAEGILRELLRQAPDDPRFSISLGKAIVGGNKGVFDAARAEEALALFAHAAAAPTARATALRESGWLLYDVGRTREAEAAADESLALQKSNSASSLKVSLAMARGDLAVARATLLTMPGDVLRNDTGASMAARVWLWSREPEKCLEALQPVTRDYLSSNRYTGPTDLLRGQAQQMAGKPQAAANAWRAALQVVEKRLESQPRDGDLLYERAHLLALLGERVAAGTALKLFEEETSNAPGRSTWDLTIHVLLDPPEKTIASLAALPAEALSLGTLRFSPEFDPLRGEPRFAALLEELEKKASPR